MDSDVDIDEWSRSDSAPASGQSADESGDAGSDDAGSQPGSPGSDSSGSAPPGSDSNERDRKKRVTVTPKDYDALKAAAEELGVSMAGVYRLGFRRLAEELDLMD